MAKQKGKSLCIFSAKGGVGKTTNLLNIAGVFALQNKKVLIIDFDTTSGNVATYLNRSFDKTIYNLVEDYINNNFQSIRYYVSKYNDNIFFLPSCKDPRQGTKISPNYIEVILEKAVYEYDVILIDTNHILNEFNVTLLDKVENILLVMTNDLLDIKNVRNLTTIFRDGGIDNYKVLLNNSLNPYRNYYSLYDIKNLIKSNIDYIIDSSFFIRGIDNYIADGNILTLDKKMPKLYPKVYKAYLSIYEDLWEDSNE